MEDVRNLLHLSLLGDQVSQNLRWCTVKHSSRIAKVLLLIIHGLNSSCYRKNKDCFKKLCKAVSLETKVAFNSSRDIASVLFSNVPESEKPAIVSIKPDDSSNTGRLTYLVSKKKMLQMNYPKNDDEGIVSTNYANDLLTDSSPLFALDCEMCKTEDGLELTKVCLIDETGSSVLCTLVKPRNPIVNYLTLYSGITCEDLSAVETRLEDVQQAVIHLLPPDAILVGQSIENDLWALRMYHPFCIDTSDMFTQSGHRGKLADLASFYLSRNIQNDEMGHDPYEDALAALDLCKLKLRMGSNLPKYSRRNLISGDESQKLELSKSLFESLKNSEKSCAVVDVRRILRRFENVAVDQIECINDSETVKKTLGAIRRHEFVCAQFHGLHTLLQGNYLSVDNLRVSLKTLDSRLDSLYQALPEKSLLITLTVPADLPTKQFGRCFVSLKTAEGTTSIT